MANKPLFIGLGVVVVAAPVLALSIGMMSQGDEPAPAASVAVAPKEAAPAPSAAAPASEAPPLSEEEKKLANPLENVGTGTLIEEKDLNALADAVDLEKDIVQGDFRKDKWARALPVAERMVNGPSDCAQRNWLTRFIEAGKAAMDGSPDYYEKVQLVATLHRSNQELTSAPGQYQERH
jgi:hypothetical protein